MLRSFVLRSATPGCGSPVVADRLWSISIMARTSAVWGIDIGQCALKAMRCRRHDDPDKVIVEAFDYIEYPKILTQPDANPTELVADAIKQFLSRNQVHNDRVAVSVSGQSGLARFIKLPPVEAKKIPDIVRYEARQQIPFDLNDVIWDYQRMGGGSEESGFVLETEIGLFAMKRDAVFRALKPFVDAGIEVDIVQLAPLALYNYVVFDMLQDLPSPEAYDPDDPPESIVLVSLGTDATDLVVTNGFKVWQRSVPLGGSHFTKALTKEMKLTFAKAEHLKRNATTAQDPKAVFQAMRPVFNDLQTELQRSLGFFTNLDRTAKIGRVVAMGNAFKLPGLRRYLAQSLGYEIDRVEAFRGLVGAEVLATPAFKDNILSFGVCYGLCLQALGCAGLRTNLLPKEITMDRLIRRKKPWAVAAAALVMLACTVSYTAHSMQFSAVKESQWKTLEDGANNVDRQSAGLIADEAAALKKFKETKDHGDHLVNDLERRKHWLEFLSAVNECLPKDDTPMPSTTDPTQLRTAIMHRKEMLITNLDSQQVDDVAKWFAAVKQWYSKIDGAPGAPPVGESSAGPAPGGARGGSSAGPSGAGRIVQIYGRHYHNADDDVDGQMYVRNTLMKNLASKKMLDMGVSFPVLIRPGGVGPEEIVIPSPKRSGSDAGAAPPAGLPMLGGGDAPSTDAKVQVKQFQFRVQFVWQPKSATEKAALLADAASTVSPAPATVPGPTPRPAAAKPVGPIGPAPAAAGPSAAPRTPPAPRAAVEPGKGLVPAAAPAGASSPSKP
ncbi:MAG: type IV pilus assembly protein PilM [Thermoguttaceae bacterium]